MPSSYWEERAKQEKAWQLKQLENDAEFGKLLDTYYNQTIEDINDSIEKELNRVGKDQVTQMDVKAYETKAKSIVAEAEKMRANGQKVTYADFSDQVNQRLKVYNATMRINRLEHLKSEVGLDMLRAGIKVDSSLRDKLSGDYQKEVIRQAGIMMDSAQRSPWTGKDAAKILMAQTNGATFSQRLWADQDALKAKLDQVLSVGMIQGQNPRKMAVRLREQVKTAVGNQRYVTERLARTESARIQTNVQLESIKKHGYNYVQWIAEPKACPACRAIASRDSGFGEGVYKVAKVPKIPDDTHPNCRCSISETWVDGKDDNLVGGKRSKALEKAIGAKKESTGDKFKRLMSTDIKELHEQDIIDIGGYIYDSLAEHGKETFVKTDSLKKNFATINSDYRAGKYNSYNDYLKAYYANGDEIQAVQDEMADSVTEKIKNYRSVGGTKISFQKGSRVKLRKMIQSAYDNYPTEWSEKAEHRNTLKVVQRGRGFYNDGTSVIAADEQSYDAQSTMYHELGHRTEHTFPEIMRLEQEFYERRTKGEKLQKLSDLTGIEKYGTETTRTDQFKDVYMGKEYLTYSGEHYGYEILSMGLEGVYRGKYNLYDDDDYAKFILGLLLKG